MRLSFAAPALRALLLVGAALCAIPGCVPQGGEGRAAGAPALLYVANAGDATVTRLEPTGGRVVGRPLPAGPSPWQVAPGPRDAAGASSLLVLSDAKAPGGEVGVTRLHRSGGRWTTQAVAVGAGSGVVWLAGDGGRYGAVAYHDAPADAGGAARRCLLALVDHRSGAVVRRHSVCDEPELVAGLAIDDGPAGPVAYVALRGPAPAVAGRIVAVDGQTGAVLATRLLPGEPRRLLLAAAPGRAGRRLYAVEAPPRWWEEDLPTATVRLLALDPVTLAVEREWPLSPLPAALAVAPDGDHAYALTAHLLMHLDLGTGTLRLLAHLPRDGAGLAVTEARVYAADPAGREVWALDRHSGRLVQTVPAGLHPVHLALGSAG